MDLGQWISVAGAAGGWAAAFSIAWINIRAFINGTLPTPREAAADKATIAKQDLTIAAKDKQIESLTTQNHQVVYELLPAINALMVGLAEAAKDR